MRVSTWSPQWVPVLFVLGAVLWLAVTLLDPADRCLDRGGCWDETHQRCELVEQGRCAP